MLFNAAKAYAVPLPGQAYRDTLMEKDAKEALQVTKEITVKFIETGRISPTNFAEVFPAVYQVVLETITRPPVSQPRSAAASGKAATNSGQDG